MMQNKSMRPPDELTYRPDIDGLRAIAVTSVVGYHAFPSWVSGGFVGVDIFFVISGFLITSIILKSSKQGGFSVLDFYFRRIRRIFPALIAMFITCLIAGWLLLFPDEFQQMGKHVSGASFFVSNFIFWSEAGYFDTASELKPLLHLWSLSIEEQFYALWPLTLLFFIRRNHPILFTFMLAAASLLLCLFGGLDKVANFYLPLSRMWELLCGGLLASLQMQSTLRERMLARHPASASVLIEFFSLSGLVFLFLAIFVLNNKTTFPGWATLLPTMGATLLIATGPQSFVNRHVLGNRLFVLIGLISYPLYLWHWPFLSFPKITEGLVLSTTTKTIALIGATIFAALTYLLIEKPLRHKSNKVSMLLLLVMLLIAGIGFLAWNEILQPRQAGSLFQKIADAKIDHPFDSALNKNYVVSIDKHQYWGIGSGTKTTVYIGDSNMNQFWLGVEATITAKNGNRKALIGNGCLMPIAHVYLAGYDNDCSEKYARIYSIAMNNPEVDTVVIGAMWRALEGFQYMDGKKTYLMNTPEGMEKAMNQLASTIRDLTTRGKTVYLILSIPGGPEFEPHNLIHRSLRGFKLAPRLEGGISLERHRDMTKNISLLLRDVAHRSGAIILDPADFLCDASWCAAVTAEGDPVYRDMDHLRGSFSYYNPQFIAQTLK